MIKTPEELGYYFDYHIKNYSVNEVCPYGDGYAAKKIIKILKKILKND
jgi:hypothetical protein